MAHSNPPAGGAGENPGKSLQLYLIVLLFAAAVYVGCMVSPPSLMDDVDAVQAQIARNMLASGDWVTARIDGIAYLEKAPLIYWLMAISFKIFGPYDWAARIPVVLAAIALAWLTAAFGTWAFGKRARILCRLMHRHLHRIVPVHAHSDSRRDGDRVMTLSMWAFLRAIDEEEPRPALWAVLFAASLGVSLLLKSLIGVVFPLAACVVYLAFTRQLFHCENLEAPASRQRCADHSRHRRAVAHSRCAAQSALFRFDACTAPPASITDFSGSSS